MQAHPRSPNPLRPHRPTWQPLGRLLLACCFLLPLWLATPTQAHAALAIKDLLVLKQVGYSENQLMQEIDKAGMKGRYNLKPAQVLRLRKTGFSLHLIRYMGIASPPKAPPKTPVTHKELKGWLAQKKPTAWIRSQLQTRGIVAAEFDAMTIVSLSRQGLPLSLLKLIHKLKQRNATPPAKTPPTTPPPAGGDLPFLPGIPSMPARPRPTAPKTRTTPSAPSILKPNAKNKRWGAKVQHPVTERERKIAARKGMRIPRPLNGIYQHAANHYAIPVPSGWSIVEDVNPNNGTKTVLFTPQSTLRIQRIHTGIAITAEYLHRSNRFLITRSLKQIARYVLQEYFTKENNVSERGALKKTSFQKKPALGITLEGKERTRAFSLRTRLLFVRDRNTVFQIAIFAKPKQFPTFYAKARGLLKKLQLRNPNDHLGTKRLAQQITVQKTIQQNIKSVVSISVAVKKKGRTVYVACGTGFVVSSNGYVLTNHHVAINSKTKQPFASYTLNFDKSTGLKSVKARYIAAHMQQSSKSGLRLKDPTTGRISIRFQRQHVDIALLKIVTPGRYHPVKLSPVKQAMLGDTVVAMGFPLEGSGINQLGNEDITATTGRISRLVRIGTQRIVNEIQHTAKVAGGNSGGPLLDVHTGSVIGINTWVGIFDKRLPRPAMGLGYYYSIPINLAWQYFPDYLQQPFARRRHLQWYELGTKWLAQGQFDPAKRAFLRAIRLRANFTPAYHQLASLYLTKALKFNNDKRFTYLKIARRWADRGLQKDLSHPKLMQLLAQIAIHKKEWQTAKYLLQKMLQENPYQWSIHYLRAQMHKEQKKYDEALNDAQNVINLAGKLIPSGYIIRGDILYAAKRYFEGQQAYRRAQTIDPSNLQARLGEAVGYIYLKQTDDALGLLTKIQRKHSFEPSVFQIKMFAHFMAKQHVKAWYAFQAYFQRCNLRHIDPDAPSLYIGGLIAQRVLNPKIRDAIVWGLWGLLLQNHTTTPYAGRAGIMLAARARKIGFHGLIYGMIRMVKNLIQEPKLRKRILSISHRIQPRGLSEKELIFMVGKTVPRWSPYLVAKLFASTPSVITISTAKKLLKLGAPYPLVYLMVRLSAKRAKQGVRPTQATTPSHGHQTQRTPSYTKRDTRIIIRVSKLAVRALYQGNLNLWLSLYDPRGNRQKQRRLFQNLYGALTSGRFVYEELPRPRIRWRKHPRLGLVAFYYFRARFGNQPTKLYYWKLRRLPRRWVLY